MWKRRFYACLLLAVEALLAGFMACQPYECAYAKDARTAKETSVKCTEVRTQSKDNPPEATNNHCYSSPQGNAAVKEAHWLRRAEWWQVIAAFLGIGVITWQAILTRRAANAVIAANEAAISKDRARLQIIANRPSLGVGQLVAITYYLNNSGLSTAFLEGGGMNLVKSGERVVVDYSKCASMAFTGSIVANSRTANEAYLMIALPAPLTQAEVDEFTGQKAFIHCYGYVKYRDVYDRPRKVRLHLRWRMIFGGIMKGQITEYWEPVGPAEENSD